MYDMFFGTEEAPVEPEAEAPAEAPAEEAEIPVEDLDESIEEEGPDVEEANDPAELPIETNDIEEVEIETNDEAEPIVDEGDQENAMNEDEGDQVDPSEDPGDDREGDASGELEEPVVESGPTSQEDTVNKLRTSDENTPKKLIDGWYVTKDGKIIPSERMYFENGLTVSMSLKDLYTRYLETAAMIRVQISRFIGSKTKSERRKRDNYNDLRKYVAKTINNGNPEVLNPIVTALMNNDKNAIKLLIVCRNKRTWFSYVTNEFFRNAAKDIINGRPVQRPQFIDQETFTTFFADVKRRHNSLKRRYTIVTDIAPHITTVEGEQVVAEPDIVAVDKQGRAHLLNVYTTNIQGYQ